MICEEYERIVRDAFVEQTEVNFKKQEEKRLSKIFSNWRTLVKKAKIKARLDKNYK